MGDPGVLHQFWLYLNEKIILRYYIVKIWYYGLNHSRKCFIRQLLDAKPPFMSSRRSAFNEVNDWVLKVYTWEKDKVYLLFPFGLADAKAKSANKINFMVVQFSKNWYWMGEFYSSFIHFADLNHFRYFCKRMLKRHKKYNIFL